MYSVVLVVALSGGVEVPEFGRRSCDGCAGACNGYVSCNGGLFSKGCNGGLFSGKGCNGGLFSRKHACDGCNGGWACHGCTTSACHGTACHGCNGWSRKGCNGGLFNKGCNGGLFSRKRCHDCTVTCNGCHAVVCHGAPACHGCTAPAKKEEKKEEKKDGKKEEKKTMAAPATIVVNLPADARLIVDGVQTRSTEARRTFVSPALEAGQDFVYTLKAEIIRDGKTQTRTEEITVRAGETTEITINFPTSVVTR